MNGLNRNNMQKTKTRRTILVAAFGAVCFTALLLYALKNPVNAFDTAIHDFFIALRVDVLNPIIVAISYTGNWQVLTPVCALLTLLPKTRRRFGLPLATASLSCVALYTLFKKLLARPRPAMEQFLLEQGGYSFPSGHAMTSAVFFILLAMILWDRSRETNPKAGFGGLSILCIVYGVLIGLSRLYVGVHWATDVLGGWCIAAVVIAVFGAIWNVGIFAKNRRR